MNRPEYIKINFSVIQKKQMTQTFSGSNFLQKVRVIFFYIIRLQTSFAYSTGSSIESPSIRSAWL